MVHPIMCQLSSCRHACARCVKWRQALFIEEALTIARTLRGTGCAWLCTCFSRFVPWKALQHPPRSECKHEGERQSSDKDL